MYWSVCYYCYYYFACIGLCMYWSLHVLVFACIGLCVTLSAYEFSRVCALACAPWHVSHCMCPNLAYHHMYTMNHDMYDSPYYEPPHVCHKQQVPFENPGFWGQSPHQSPSRVYTCQFPTLAAVCHGSHHAVSGVGPTATCRCCGQAV